MCGIIGISSNKSVSASIINSLKKLEYRGYDSAGIATLSEWLINEVKSEGRVENLEKNFDLKNFQEILELDMLDGQHMVFQIVLMHILTSSTMFQLFIMELLKIQHY